MIILTTVLVVPVVSVFVCLALDNAKLIGGRA